jgi:hypothetical protein
MIKFKMVPISLMTVKMILSVLSMNSVYLQISSEIQSLTRRNAFKFAVLTQTVCPITVLKTRLGYSSTGTQLVKIVLDPATALKIWYKLTELV